MLPFLEAITGCSMFTLQLIAVLEPKTDLVCISLHLYTITEKVATCQLLSEEMGATVADGVCSVEMKQPWTSLNLNNQPPRDTLSMLI